MKRVPRTSKQIMREKRELVAAQRWEAVLLAHLTHRPMAACLARLLARNWTPPRRRRFKPAGDS